MARRTRSAPPRRPGRGWLARLRASLRARPIGAWYILSGIVAVTLYTVAAPVEAVFYGVPVLAALFLPLAQNGAVVAAVRHPAIATASFTIASAWLRLWQPEEEPPWPWSVTGIIGFTLLVATVWTCHGWRYGLIAFLAPNVVLSAAMVLHPDAVVLASVIVAFALGGGAVVVGALLYERVRMSGQLARERELSASELERRVIAEERQRIARELHDVVAHGLSLIQVQATSARYRIPGVPDEVAAEFDDIARSARGALGEMRRLLGALRGDDSAETAPQPTIDDIPRLVAETERAGAVVRLHFDAPPDTPAAVGIAAFRIVQEGVSNAVRHAPGADIAVSVGSHDRALLVEIESGAGDAPPVDPGSREAGHGLVGMRERTVMLGGTLMAGRTASGGFRVAASLPLSGPDAGERMSDAPEHGEADG